jgi:apolipoprotein D and lipocalin family protein
MLEAPMRIVLLMAAMLFVPVTTAGVTEALQTVERVDLERYAGDWYEIARLPAWFQRKCLQSRASYEIAAADRIAVTNSCRTRSGDIDVATGTATVVDPETNAKLEVVFDNWFSRLFPGLTKGDYWIIHLDETYSEVLVGTPDRDYLWIMTRRKKVEPRTLARLIGIAAAKGFPVDELIVHEGAVQTGP